MPKTADDLLPTLARLGYDLHATYHGAAIFAEDFPELLDEIDSVIGETHVPITEIIRGGGGEAKLTQRMRHALSGRGWKKQNFHVEKTIDNQTTYAASHEVDHVKRSVAGTVALEIEWNNKDPFYDRDLDNFHRLHADGAVSVGVIVTRGATFQAGIENRLREYAVAQDFRSFADLEAAAIARTRRQDKMMCAVLDKGKVDFPAARAKAFANDKFGAATTHWLKLIDRLDRGVGSPCPVLAIGIPLSVLEP